MSQTETQLLDIFKVTLIFTKRIMTYLLECNRACRIDSRPHVGEYYDELIRCVYYSSKLTEFHRRKLRDTKLEEAVPNPLWFIQREQTTKY